MIRIQVSEEAKPLITQFFNELFESLEKNVGVVIMLNEDKGTFSVNGIEINARIWGEADALRCEFTTSAETLPGSRASLRIAPSTNRSSRFFCSVASHPRLKTGHNLSVSKASKGIREIIRHVEKVRAKPLPEVIE